MSGKGLSGPRPEKTVVKSIPRVKKTSSTVSTSKKAKLEFPVGRIRTQLKKDGVASRVSMSSAVALAAVFEYFVSEILSTTDENMRKMEAEKRSPSTEGKFGRISTRALKLTLCNDEEFLEFLKHTDIKHSGVVPKIYLSKKDKAAYKKGKNNTNNNDVIDKAEAAAST